MLGGGKKTHFRFSNTHQPIKRILTAQNGRYQPETGQNPQKNMKESKIDCSTPRPTARRQSFGTNNGSFTALAA